MLVIIEGAERTGKSTLAKAFEEEGFINFKDIPNTYGSIEEYDPNVMVNRIDAMLNMLIKLNDKGVDVVVDRFHISAKVFDKIYRNHTFSNYTYIDKMLSCLDCRLVFLTRFLDDDYLYDHPICDDEMKLCDLIEEFEYQFEKSQIEKKYEYDILKDDVYSIVDSVKEGKKQKKEEELLHYDFYLASPFFNEVQRDRMEGILSILRTAGYKVYAPIEAGLVAATASDSFISEVFRSNVEAIKNCNKVFAITDGKDMGTIWEAGYAYGIGKPVIYFAETLGDNPFNIMLSESGKGIFTKRTDVMSAAETGDFFRKEKVNRE